MEYNIFLKFGIKNSDDEVKRLQRLLNAKGYHTDVDGIFGMETDLRVREFQESNGLAKDGIVGFQTWSALNDLTIPKRAIIDHPALDGLKIKQTFLPTYCYYQSVVEKKQIVLHHTAGGPTAQPVYESWKTSANKVATAFVIERNGQIYQMFDENHWAWHLGVQQNDRVRKFAQGLDACSIGIELCNFGYLTKVTEKHIGGKSYYKTYVNSEIPSDEVCDLGQMWRGMEYFHKYSAAQIISACKLVKYLAEKHKIPLSGFYTPQDNWFDINQEALDGNPGLFNHSNYRTDKTDLSPQPEIIDALCKLKNIYA